MAGRTMESVIRLFREAATTNTGTRREREDEREEGEEGEREEDEGMGREGKRIHGEKRVYAHQRTRTPRAPRSIRLTFAVCLPLSWVPRFPGSLGFLGLFVCS